MNQRANQNSHSSPEQLHALIDQRLDPGEGTIVAAHLEVCPGCRSLYESLVRFDSACKRVPLESVSPGFTRSVLASLGIVPKTPLVFRLLEHAAYLFGMLLVLAFMTAAFVLTGVIRSEQVPASSGPEGKVLDTIGTGLSQATGVLSGWLTGLFPSGVTFGTLSISAVIVVVVLALAIVDKRVTGRFAQRVR